MRPYTIICDIDGTLIKHREDITTQTTDEPILLENTLNKLKEWEAKGYFIILITGRKESQRKATKKQLLKAGIFYDQLIMGVGGGARVLINDKKPDGTLTAFCHNLNRNEGIGKINDY